MKISLIDRLIRNSRKRKSKSLYCRSYNHLFKRTHYRKIPTIKFHKKKIYNMLIIFTFVVIFYMSPISKKIAAFAESRFLINDNKKDYWSPEAPQPIPETKYVFPDISNSFMLSLANDYYLGKEKTTIEDIDLFSEHILLVLEYHNQTGELFNLPYNFRIKETIPIQEFRTTENIDEYDGQIFDAYQNTIITPNALSYHRIGITALNALNLLKKTGNVEQTDYIYYAELAFYAFGNEYILDRPTEGTRADWFYRVAQIYDYLGWVSDDKDPPFQQEMYFISVGFLHLSFASLSAINFDEKKCSVYRHDIWELDLVMLYRLGIYFNNGESFLNRLKEHSNTINNLYLTTEEKNEVQSIMDKVTEWERISGNKFL